jgi:hypothetical protein
MEQVNTSDEFQHVERYRVAVLFAPNEFSTTQ